MSHIRRFDERLGGGFGNHLDPNKDDYRVYVVSKYNNAVRRYAEHGSIDDMPDPEFIEVAESEGTVYTLHGLQENWNKYSDTMPYPDSSFVRILPKSVFGKIQ